MGREAGQPDGSSAKAAAYGDDGFAGIGVGDLEDFGVKRRRGGRSGKGFWSVTHIYCVSLSVRASRRTFRRRRSGQFLRHSTRHPAQVVGTWPWEERPLI